MTQKIYRIIPRIAGDEGDVYYGSTSQHLLCNRMSCHRSDYKHWTREEHHFVTVFEIFEKYGLENCKIELVEEFKYAITDDDLRRAEGQYILNNKCVNKINPTPVSRDDYKIRKKIYYKNVICTDPDKLAKHRNTAKSFLKKKQEEGPIQCVCGETYTYKHKSRHIASEKHKLGTDPEYKLQKETELKLKRDEAKKRNAIYKKEWYEANKVGIPKN
jgi:hypothetical protein